MKQKLMMQIFNEDPDGGWDLRGDVYFWNLLRSYLSHNNPGGCNQESLDYAVSFLYERVTGQKLRGKGADYVEFFDFGGMSGGCLSREWWIDEALPLLHERLDAFNGDCTDGKYKAYVLEEDITLRRDDVIVNTTNEKLEPGGGVSGAIHKAAGQQLWVDLQKISPDEDGVRCPIGGFKSSLAVGNLHCKAVYCVVGPSCPRGITDGLEDALRTCYSRVIYDAYENGYRSIAFPAISTGKNGFPKAEAAQIAAEAVIRECKVHPDLKVVICCPIKRDADFYRVALAEAAKPFEKEF